MSQAVLQDSSSLKAALRTASPETLEAICEFWGLKFPSSQSTGGNLALAYADFLYPRLQTAQYFRPAFEKLSQEEKDTLYFLAVHGGELPVAELAERCFLGDEDTAWTYIESLMQKGFLYTCESEVDPGQKVICLPESHLRMIDLPPHLQGFLGGILRGLPEEQLQKIAELVMRKKPRTSKASALRQIIRKAMLDPHKLHDYLARITDQEHDLFNLIMNRRGFCLYRDLLEPGKQKRFDHAKAEMLNNLITFSGLIFTVQEGQNKHMNLLMVPRDIFHIVSTEYHADRRSLVELDALSASTPEFRPVMVLDNSQSLLRDIAIFGAQFDTFSIKRLAGGGISKLDLKKALACLSANKSLRYAEFLATYLICRKFLIQVGEEWKTSEAFRRWLVEPTKCHRDVFYWWLHTTDWNEENTEANLLNSEVPGRDTAGLLQLRNIILKSLAGLAGDVWIGFDAFVESILPQIETSLAGRRGFGFRRSAAPLKPVLQNIIAESLDWLGIVAIGLKDSAGVEAVGAKPEPAPKRPAGSKAPPRKPVRKENFQFIFRPTPAGRAFITSDWFERDVLPEDEVLDDPSQHHPSWLIVQPNLEIVTPPDFSLEDTYLLSNFCAVRNVDVMTTYELTKESLGRALGRGIRARDIINFLSQRNRVEIPETIKQMVNECAGKHGEARVGHAGGYITMDDPMLAEQIRANPKLSGYIKDVLSNTVIMLNPSADVAKVCKELRNIGLMAHAESGTVHVTSTDDYHLTLSAQEYYDLLAAMRLVTSMEKTLETEITEGRAAALAHKLKPESGTYFTMSLGAESTTNSFQKKFDFAFQKLKDEIADKYKGQVSRLVTKSISGRSPSKYNFKGKNPAIERDDIVELLTFAQDYDLDAEILYVKQNEQETKITISPKSFEGERLYAHCPETDTDAIYSLKRILRARLP